MGSKVDKRKPEEEEEEDDNVDESSVEEKGEDESNDDNDDGEVHDTEGDSDVDNDDQPKTSQTSQDLVVKKTSDSITVKSKTTTATTNESKEEETNNENEESDSKNALSDATFESLGVVSTLADACRHLNWVTATEIQKEVLPEALAGRDVIGLAETGSGKTGAFCIPMLQSLLKNPVRAISALILTPTRELAFQIHQVVQALGQTIGATSACIVGGVDRTSQAICIARNPHVLIATPGRLLDHIKDTKGFNLRSVRYLVLDEADRMLSMDFEEELHQILDQLTSTGRQTMLFSATMTNQVQKLQRASLKDPVRVEVSTKFQTPKALLQYYMFIPAKYKDCYFTYLINEHAGQSLLAFAATCNNVQRLTLMLRNLGFPAVCLHGQMNQAKRLGALQKFTSGQRTILICTDVASRGLDLPNVDCVINFDLPGHGKEYIHRVGRTARAGKSGKTIAMVTQYDVEIYQRIEALLGKKLPEYKTEEETVLILLERVNEAQRLATRELKEQHSSHGKGGRHGNRKRRGDDDHDGGGGDGENFEHSIKKEVRNGYFAGGSGGKGGALPNQRGSSSKKPKTHHRRNK